MNEHIQIPGEAELMRNLKPAKPEEEFNFRCTLCGDCCKHIKNSVAMEALDVFKLSRHLKQAGNPVWRMEDILAEYTTLIPLTDFGYPMFFINTKGPDDSCVFLNGCKCSIQDAKPRTCRMYPMTAEPRDAGESWNYYIIAERSHHYTSPGIRVGDWMADCLSDKDREYTKADIFAAIRIGILMQQCLNAGVDIGHVLEAVLYYRYINFDTDKPFMPQYHSNNAALMRLLENMVKGEQK